MTHRIDPDEHYIEGETVIWEFTVEDSDGNTKDLTGGSVEWYLVDDEYEANSNSILYHGHSSVNATLASAQDGRVDVSIAASATKGMGGEVHWHRLQVKDSAGNLQKWSGKFPIDRA